MARLMESEETYFSTVRGMCRHCRRIVPARIFFKAGKVWQQSICEKHRDNKPALIAGDMHWYLENAIAGRQDHSPLKKAEPLSKGCPHDCGPCAWHATPCQLPVISITNACNLDCPICFTYNRKDRIYNMTVDEMRRTVAWILESSGPVDLVNITGGEPTLHPELLEILKVCSNPGIGRITMNSNGLLLAKDKKLCAKLADLGVYVILSFDTFDPETSVLLHGRDIVEQKLKAVENLTAAGVRMTLLNVLVRGVNENSISKILGMMKENDKILSLTVQTMTYTGQGGSSFLEREHLPADEATRIVCRESAGELQSGDFSTRPSAHPLCYMTCYMLKSGDKFLPFARFVPEEKLKSMMSDSYLLRLENEKDFFKDTINELYAKGDSGQLGVFRELVELLYPGDRAITMFERQRLAESSVRTVYIHSHMDEDNFDCSRAMLCPDLVPSEPGRLIPACTYNLFYRMKDERFYVGK